MIAAFRKTKLTPPELARQWGIDVAKVLTWIRSGELRAVNLATRRDSRPRYAIDVADIALFEAARAVQPPTPRVRRRQRVDPSVIQFF
ncbi:MAG: DNA-binding protein [Thermoguttaceae bacterium]